MFEHRPKENVYWDELRELLHEVRKDAKAQFSDEHFIELGKAYDQGFTEGRKHSTSIREQVVEFHQAFGQPVLGTPQVPSDDRVRLRLRLIAEEFFELLDACDLPYTQSMRETFDANLTHPTKVDLVELADALADLDYVIEGTRLEFGINGAPIAAEVHRSNMAKVGGTMREDGKLQKPEGWTPPDIKRELKLQGWKDDEDA